MMQSYEANERKQCQNASPSWTFVGSSGTFVAQIVLVSYAMDKHKLLCWFGVLDN